MKPIKSCRWWGIRRSKKEWKIMWHWIIIKNEIGIEKNIKLCFFLSLLYVIWYRYDINIAWTLFVCVFTLLIIFLPPQLSSFCEDIIKVCCYLFSVFSKAFLVTQSTIFPFLNLNIVCVCATLLQPSLLFYEILYELLRYEML